MSATSQFSKPEATPLSNKTGVCKPLEIWLRHDSYDYNPAPDYFSATELLRPTKQIILSRRFPEQGDIIDRYYAVRGSALHESIERALAASGEECLMEQRQTRELDDVVIGGKFDIIMDGTLYDFKTTSVSSYQGGKREKDYILQASIYRWLNPTLVTNPKFTICFVLTDWSDRGLLRSGDYPASPCPSKIFDLYSLEKTEYFLKQKIADIKKNQDKKEEEMLCLHEELWPAPTKYKYFANAESTRATKVFDTLEEANAYAAGKKGVVKTVLGENMRCKYCPCAAHCTQWDK